MLGTLISYVAGVEVSTFDDFGTKTGEAKPNLVLHRRLLARSRPDDLRALEGPLLGCPRLPDDLILLIVVSILALVQATEVLRALGLFAFLAGSSFLFYRMVKAMARIQMPDRGGNTGNYGCAHRPGAGSYTGYSHEGGDG